MDPQSSRARHLSVCLDWVAPYKLHQIYMEHVNALTNFANLVSNSSPASLIRWTTFDVEWSSLVCMHKLSSNLGLLWSLLWLIKRTQMALWTKMFACSQDNLTWPSQTIPIYTWWCRKGGGDYSKPSIVVIVPRLCFPYSYIAYDTQGFVTSNVRNFTIMWSPFISPIMHAYLMLCLRLSHSNLGNLPTGRKKYQQHRVQFGVTN